MINNLADLYPIFCRLAPLQPSAGGEWGVGGGRTGSIIFASAPTADLVTFISVSCRACCLRACVSLSLSLPSLPRLGENMLLMESLSLSLSLSLSTSASTLRYNDHACWLPGGDDDDKD